MNRRAFVVFGLGLLVSMDKVFAEVWAVVGKMGYKEVAPPNMVKLGKTCDSCGWFAAGLCKFPGIMKAANSDKVHVKPKGICSMWKKA